MSYVDFHILNRAAAGQDNIERSVNYLTENLSLFLRPHESVLICFPAGDPGSLGSLLDQAVRQADGNPVIWGADTRWKTLLRLAFISHATTIIAPPLIVLGLTKLAKITRTPLNIFNVMTAGYPCMDWMIDGIRRGLDCHTWSCFGPGTGAVISGFSCAKSRGVHIRDDAFSFEIVDAQGQPVSPGTVGSVILSPKNQPSVRYRVPEHARLDLSPCECGSSSPRLMDISVGFDADRTLAELGQQLMYWSSILDCDLRQGEYGLEMELVVFPGEQLPKLPSCAKRILRPWDPERDSPMMLIPSWINPNLRRENH